MDIINNLGLTDLTPEYNPNYCEECNWTGFIIDPITKAKKQCNCIFKNKLKYIYKASNIPEQYWYKTVEDDWNDKQDGAGNDLGLNKKTSEYIKGFLIWYIKNYDNLIQGYELRLKHSKNRQSIIKSLVIKGAEGSGKTFITSVLAQEAIKKGYITKYYAWTELYYYLNEFRSPKLIEYFEEFKNAEFVFIDEVKPYKVQGQALEFNLDRLIMQRTLSGKPTIISTSYELGALDLSEQFVKFLKNCFWVNLPILNGDE